MEKNYCKQKQDLVEKLAAALDAIDTIRHQSFRHCVEHYSWQNMVSKYDAVFSGV